MNPWARHYQLAWEERAGNPDLPLWLRVSALAYGKHRANGHATFGIGDVSLVLATVDRTTGEVVPASRQHVYRAIATAIRYGFLLEGSSSRCLVVPSHAVTGGMGHENERCKWHDKKGVSRAAA